MKAEQEDGGTEDLLDFDKDMIEVERQYDLVAEQVRSDDYKRRREGAKT